MTRGRDSRSAEAQIYRPLYNSARWKRLRLDQLEAFPLCAMCLEQGFFTEATVCDHVNIDKGTEDKFFAGPFQSLCADCHDREKQQNEHRGYSTRLGLDGFPLDPMHPANGGKPVGRQGLGVFAHPTWFRPTYVPLSIVCGPPAAGKSTYVQAHAAPGDLVLDLDAIALEAHGVRLSRLDKQDMLACLKTRNQRLGNLMWAKARGTAPHAWLIVSEPLARKRQWWADTVRPQEIIVLETPAALCLARAKADAGTARAPNLRDLVQRWWSDYSKRQGDTCIKPDP